jgi:hypothetical protein
MSGVFVFHATGPYSNIAKVRDQLIIVANRVPQDNLAVGLPLIKVVWISVPRGDDLFLLLDDLLGCG